MALVKCPDCGKMVSSRAQACPECGCPAEYFEDDSIKKDAAADIEEKEGLTKNNEKDIT